jgi:asparagine synthase (glutamine-hydrolysing)
MTLVTRHSFLNMCGIAGIVGPTDMESATFAVKRMIAALARRGPDAEGLTVLTNAVLGHRRLAIFDLTDAGAQPMTSADRSLSVVFNGAIYNFRALRAELEKLGFRFRSDSDTEVLLHGYRAWGMEALVRRLRGMFAFGLWDVQAQKLFLARDRLGVKPLVYASRNESLAFASTVGALERSGYARGIDEKAVVEFLRWGFVGEDRCIYRAVQKLPAATILEWCAGRIRQYRYWHPPSPTAAPRLSFGDAVADVERRLREAVAIRLDADVPVAVLLSGGIDSSLICWAVADLGADLTAYTVGVPGDPWDESAQSALTARRLGIRHQVLPMSTDDLPEIDELLFAYDEPFACSSALGMLRISRAIAASAKVVLTGDGGDDLFLGYPRHRHLWLAQGLSHCVPSGWTQTWNRWGRQISRVGPLRRAGAMIDYATGGVTAYFEKSTHLTGYGEKNLLGPRFSDPMSETAPISTPSNGMVEALVNFEVQGRFVGEYLKKVDGATMHYGLEARSPFLDQELWNFGCKLPVSLRLHHGELKAILRALARRHIGIGIAARKKRGFRIPAQRWLASRWLARAEQTLGDSMLAREGWIDSRNTLAELRRSALRGAASEELWNIFVLESWMQHDRQERREHGNFSSARRTSMTSSTAVSC